MLIGVLLIEVVLIGVFVVDVFVVDVRSHHEQRRLFTVCDDSTTIVTNGAIMVATSVTPHGAQLASAIPSGMAHV